MYESHQKQCRRRPRRLRSRRWPVARGHQRRDPGPESDAATRSVTSGFALMIATALHSIATGNLLPAWVKVVCVDINPATGDQVERPRDLPDRLASSPTSNPFLRSLAGLLGSSLDQGVASHDHEHEQEHQSDASRILMCPPDYYGIEYEINPWMNRDVGS